MSDINIVDVGFSVCPNKNHDRLFSRHGPNDQVPRPQPCRWQHQPSARPGAATPSVGPTGICLESWSFCV